MDQSNEGGVLEEMMMMVDREPLSPSDRLIMAEMYRCIITVAEGWRSYLDQHAHLLDIEITMDHSLNCSCGRFFEQHPTTIDGAEGEILEQMINQIRWGRCACLNNSDPTNPLHIAIKPAKKTLLHAAAASGYQSSEIVEYLLDKKCFVNRMTNLYSYTPLFRAVCSKSEAVISTLLGHDYIDINLRSRTERHTPLLEAIFNRHYPIINLLLAKSTVNLNVRNFRQETPVIVAARMGEDIILEQLLKMGADPDSRDQRGMTALMFSVLYGMKTVTKVLLRYNADLTQRNANGETPLILAISSDSYEVAQILLEARANVDDVSEDSYPALMVATYSNYANMVQLLLAHGANVHLTNDTGYQAIHLAAWNGYMNILLKLLEAGALPDVRTQDRNTPLSLAVHGNHLPVVEILMDRDCDINNADKDLDTPLHYATFNGNVTCVQKLLEKGSDPDAMNRLGVTPLWNAVYRGHLKVVKILIQKNVALNVPSQGIEQHAQSDQVVTVYDVPHTPLWVAASHGNAEIALLLITAGCDIAQEGWIGLNEFPGKSQENLSLREVLVYYYSVPRPLTFQCRILLRRLAGRDMRTFVRRLRVPQKFRDFVLLKDALD